MKTAVILDSGSYYYVDKIDVEGVFAIPLQIIHGQDAFLESVEISLDQVNTLLLDKQLLQTSLPSIGMIEDLFSDLKAKGYDQILAVPITTGISGTLNAMQTAATFLDLKFYAIDSYTTAWLTQIIGLHARTLLDQGMLVEDVIKSFDSIIDHSDTFVIADDLSHLSRSGRLSPLGAALGGFLRIKPVLHLNKKTKGVIDAFDKVRTMSKAIDTVIDYMKSQGVGKGYYIAIADVAVPTLREVTAEKIRLAFPDTLVRENMLISTVSVHVGIGSIAIQYGLLPQ